MRTLLFCLVFLLARPLTALAEPTKDADYNRAHAEEQFAAALGNAKFAAKHSLRVPSLSGQPDKNQWHEIGVWEGYTLSYRRSSGSTVEVRALAQGAKAPHAKLVALVCYTQDIPAVAFSKTDLAYAATHWQSFRDNGGLNYAQPAADYGTSPFIADREKGIVSASVVAWGPAWKLHEKQFEIRLILLN